MRWDKGIEPTRRGAWVRLYDIPVHAWNVEFFKLCVLDYGSFLRAYSYIVEKVKLDYARVLIATSAMKVIKGVEKLLVDGVMVEVKIMEEWGYALGEDVCLYENGNASEASHTDNE
ncbi:sulfate transporter [Trifolium medium]|uniref:Sulfate transporter n=1 Tax=Trifolium medium TaxID=97028 RepID=A0A392PJ58_9FABA|nr:sulfate transporter [Trifolium medium]